MERNARREIADTLSGISVDLGTARYELETVGDIDEASRIVVRAEKRVRHLADQLGLDLPAGRSN